MRRRRRRWAKRLSPAYGKDTNAADALAALLASKGYDDVTVTVKAAAGDAKASIDADGTIHYYFDAGMSSRSSYFYATFVLSLDGASVEKEVYVHITWDLARAQAVLQAELDRITLPTEPVTSLTLPRYPVKEGIDRRRLITASTTTSTPGRPSPGRAPTTRSSRSARHPTRRTTRPTPRRSPAPRQTSR